MSNKIERTFFWFTDGNESLNHLNEKYIPMSFFLNNLISERYDGRKIKFININFRTEDTYKLHPEAAKYFVHFYNGHLNYDDVFDLQAFSMLEETKKAKFIWRRALKILEEISLKLKNKELSKAIKYAYSKEIEIMDIINV